MIIFRSRVDQFAYYQTTIQIKRSDRRCASDKAGIALKAVQIIPSSLLPERDEVALRDFLQGCRETAREKNHFQIASISLAVKHIAPLAVLQSIYEPKERHFYIERQVDDHALAGAEAVVSATFDGDGRFEKVKAFADEILDNTIAVGDLDANFTGPHFFTAFTFDSHPDTSSPFRGATVFLPRWQVSRFKDKYGAVANIRVDPDTDLEELVGRIMTAYARFESFDYHDGIVEPSASKLHPIDQKELIPEVYRKAVTNALNDIHKGDYEKIVLARSVQLKAQTDWKPLETLEKLRERFANCYTFSFGGGQTNSFIGATPEKLISVRNGILTTEAIAGSAPRGTNLKEDARLGRALLESKKDLWEHECVRDSIMRRLQKVGLEPVSAAQPDLLQLPNVQHLHTPISAAVKSDDIHVLDIVAEMHPTPAVGGTPRGAAISKIKELEKIERGLYAGVVGWFNHLNEGEMVVGIRSAMIDGPVAQLYAGAGIVEGSEPDREYAETSMKLRALLDVLVD